MRIGRVCIMTTGFLVLCATGARADLINGGFEAYNQPANSFAFFADAAHGGLPGWRTTATDGQIEVWGSGFNGFGDAPHTPSYEGTDFAELNANQVSTLYQDVAGISYGELIGFQFAHRGREGVDTMRLTITDLGRDGIFGTADDATLYTNLYSDGNQAWGHYSGILMAPSNGDVLRFAYESISAAGGDRGIGNFLDGVAFGVNAVPEPSTILLLGGALPLVLAAARRLRRSEADRR